jgi:hypothetical protein
VSLKSTAFFLAVISSAAPALADKIPLDLQNRESLSHRIYETELAAHD